jgi:protein-S-isoprenylcysteine O-methyltransferase Ste14
VVRHPMYFGALVMMVGTAPALDSDWGLLLLLPGLVALSARIADEEKMLTAELAGYDEYTRRVRYRLVPGVW